MTKTFLITAISLLDPTAPTEGMRSSDIQAWALQNATVTTEPGTSIENATVLIEDGLITGVGTEIKIPEYAKKIDCSNKHLYPGFIDPTVMIDAREESRSAGKSRHWNKKIKSDISLDNAAGGSADESILKQYRESGFAIAGLQPAQGIFRGTGTIIFLNDDQSRLLGKRFMGMSLEYGGDWSSASYPGSKMGAIALARQVLSDASWHLDCLNRSSKSPNMLKAPARNDALESLKDCLNRSQLVLVDSKDELDALRLSSLCEEAGLAPIHLGSGLEFRRIQDIANLKEFFILPLDFPEQPNLTSLDDADSISLRELLTWEHAPTNPARLRDAGVKFALTAHRLSSPKNFRKFAAKTLQAGLTEKELLAACTTTPARILGLHKGCGTISLGAPANIIVSNGPIFNEKTKISGMWVGGIRYKLEKEKYPSFAGSGQMNIRFENGLEQNINARLSTEQKIFEIELNEKKIQSKQFHQQANLLRIVIDSQIFGSTGWTRISARVQKNHVAGRGELDNGQTFRFDLSLDSENWTPASKNTQKEGRRKASNVSGEWDGIFEFPGSDESIPVRLVLENLQENEISGLMQVMGNETPITEGSYDQDSGLIEARLQSSREEQMDFTITGQVEKNSMSIEVDLSNMGMLDPIGMTLNREGPQEEEEEEEEEEKEKDDDASKVISKKEIINHEKILPVPLGAYGRLSIPKEENIRFNNVTLWTGDKLGIVKNGCLLINNGKITYSGPMPGPSNKIGELIVDGSDKHITPGLIDCHSHTGISGGVNEWTQYITSEVGIEDVINPDDIDWYRQLAGGLTVANQLHGSANPIGGRNSVVKLRWGGNAKDFLMKEAAKGIKFALGENVKRSQSRYPNTRMGVEAVIRDGFEAAKHYRKMQTRWERLDTQKKMREMKPRIDFELEVLNEVLEGERLIHCHSYRQDEILMLIRVADDYDFTIGTLQHVLEGYKVAPEIAQHGAGASSFSDWWAYKMEVMDATPYSPAVMYEAGVLVSLNSDDSNLARRMNTEGAKPVRYGGVKPDEGLKMVSTNAAKQLNIFNTTGSLTKGKSADFAVWSGSPISTMSICLETWIDGRRYFDRKEAKELQKRDKAERLRLINKILNIQLGQSPSSKNTSNTNKNYLSHALGTVVSENSWWINSRFADEPSSGHSMVTGACVCNEALVHDHNHGHSHDHDHNGDTE